MKMFFQGCRHLSVLALLLTLLNALATPIFAAPETPNAGGTFWVATWVDDSNAADNWISLREALLLARGGTGAKGLNRGLTVSELIHIEGCDFGVDGDGHARISGGCGAGVIDTIRFATYSQRYTAKIKATLPAIDDSQPTIIDGASSSIRPVLDFGVNNGTPGLEVNSNNNAIKGVTILGNHCEKNTFCPLLAGITLNGSGNQVSNVSVARVVGHGMIVKGQNNTLDDVQIGVLDKNSPLCLLPGLADNGVTSTGITIADGAQNSTVTNSAIGCGKNANWAAIEVGANTQATTIGPNNHIGTNGTAGLANQGNAGIGVLLLNAEQVNVVNNIIAYSGKAGLVLQGSSNNTVAGNLIRNNSSDGIQLLGTANNNSIGSTSLSRPNPNKIGLNQGHGIYLGPNADAPNVTPTDNHLLNNWIGTLDVVKAAANQGSGIMLDGASNNQVGDPAAPPNVIGGNSAHGILLTNGAHDNTLANNYVGTNGFTLVGNGGSGLVINKGAHHNLVGGSDSATANLVAASGFQGIVLEGNDTNSNIFTHNRVFRNKATGVLIMGGANNNSFGGVGLFGGLVNQVFKNEGPGIEIAGGAHHNLVGGNSIYDNLGAGIRLADAATQHNRVELAKISTNHSVDGAGVAQVQGADNNFWSQISTYENESLGIDTSAGLPYPTISAIGVNTDTVIVTGNALPTNANQQVTVEVYRSATDPSGFGEGQIYIGSTQVAADGFFAVGTKGKGGCFTAFQTISSNGSKKSSEFSQVVCKGTPQNITFAAIADKFVKEPPFAINPTASSGLPVKVEALGQCTVAQNQVTITGAGQCTLLATQDGNESVAPAPNRIVQFAINKKTQSINWAFSEAEKNKWVNDPPFGVNATASSGLPVTYAALGACTINGNQVTLTGAEGYCLLFALQAGNDEYAAATDNVEIALSVSRLAQTIYFDPLPNKLTSDPAFLLNATASSNLPVSYFAEGVCAVNGATVTLSGQAGVCTIAAVQGGDALYAPAPEMGYSFMVTDPAKQNQTINFAPLADKLLGDAPFALNATASSGLAVNYTELTPLTCTVENSQVALVATGLCTVRASQPGDAAFNPAPEVEQSFVINDPNKQNQNITFAEIANQTLGNGPVALNASATSGLPVTIVSKTPAICTVANNQVTLLASDNCTLIASQPGDATFNPAPPVTRTFHVQPLVGQNGAQTLYLPVVRR